MMLGRGCARRRTVRMGSPSQEFTCHLARCPEIWVVVDLVLWGCVGGVGLGSRINRDVSHNVLAGTAAMARARRWCPPRGHTRRSRGPSRLRADRTPARRHLGASAQPARPAARARLFAHAGRPWLAAGRHPRWPAPRALPGRDGERRWGKGLARMGATTVRSKVEQFC